MTGLADALALVLPALDPALATPAAARQMRHVSGVLPPIYRGGFECRLEAHDPQLDLQQCILPTDGEPAAFAALLASEEYSAGVPLSLAWVAVRRLCEEWSREDSPLGEALRDLWLEFDAPAALPSRLTQLTPSLFSGVGDWSKPPEASWTAAATVLPFLAQDRDPAPLLAGLAWCRAACAEAVRIDHVGVMVGRESAGCRIHLVGVRLEAMGDVLHSIGWPGDPIVVQRLAGKLLEFVDSILLCLDLAEAVRPRLGLECVFSPSPETDSRLPELLAHLVESGLCSSSKQAALLRWPGWLLPSESVTPWPASLIARELRQPPTRLGAFARRWSHLKLIHEPGQPLRAKAYLYFAPQWLQTGGDGIPSSVAPDSTLRSRPPLSTQKPEVRRSTGLAAAIEAATDFLIGSRNQAGLWRDFLCPTNNAGQRILSASADEWVRGYVGSVLVTGESEEGRTVARTAWAVLLNRRGSDSGWGYSTLSAQDSDSTTWVLRLAAALGVEPTERGRNARRFLRQQMTANGGIACFPAGYYRPLGSPDGWSAPHASITAAAAVLELGPHPIEFLLREQREDGSWTDYWWDDDEYTTARAVEALLQHDRLESRSAAFRAMRWASSRVGKAGAVGESAFATSLCVEILARGWREGLAEAAVAPATRWLIDQQRENGSFPPSARMRIPPAECVNVQDWQGPMVHTIDDAALFTTATALAALQLVYSLGPGVLGGE
jgi:hypothetical protein